MAASEKRQGTKSRDGDTLVVWKLDRLARSLKQLIETVEDLGQRGIGLRSITESIDTATSGGKLIFHVFGALAEFERSVIRERTQAGLKAARARGRVGGRPAGLNDADLAEARALLRDPDISVAQVAKRLGVAESTLYRYLPGGRAALGDLERVEAKEIQDSLKARSVILCVCLSNIEG